MFDSQIDCSFMTGNGLGNKLRPNCFGFDKNSPGNLRNNFPQTNKVKCNSELILKTDQKTGQIKKELTIATLRERRKPCPDCQDSKQIYAENGIDIVPCTLCTEVVTS